MAISRLREIPTVVAWQAEVRRINLLKIIWLAQFNIEAS